MITLEEICGYLPYRVAMYSEKTKKFLERKNVKYTPTFLRMVTIEKLFWVGHESDSRHLAETDYKPILRPLSDLTNEIEHNGEKFVPIVELAKIYEGGSIFGTYKTTIENEIAAVKYLDSGDFKTVFAYHFNSQCFGVHTVDDENFHIVTNQVKLFQKLYEWHFDIHNLIQRNEAININTI